MALATLSGTAGAQDVTLDSAAETIDNYAGEYCEIIDGSSANSARCHPATPLIVGRDGGRRHRLLVHVVPGVPAGALVLSAGLKPLYAQQTARADGQIAVHALTRGFSAQATWNQATSSALWTTPGGDVETPAVTDRSVPQAAYGNRVWFGVSEPVQRVASGRATATDVLLKAVDENQPLGIGFERFLLRTWYAERTGFAPSQTYERFALSDGTVVAVNVGNGNVVVQSDDIRFTGGQGTFPLSRYFNSLAPGTGGTFGAGSRGDIGSIALQRNADDGSYVLFGPGAADGVFRRNADGSFTAPDGLEATLTEQREGTVTIQFHEVPDIWTFDASSPSQRLVKITADYGYEMNASYGLNGVVRMTDTDGHSATFGYDGSGDMRTITDENGAVRRYAYDGDHRLVEYAPPSGSSTRYAYDGLGRLTRIGLPDASALRIGWIGTTLKPATVTPVSNTGVDQPSTSFAWATGFDPVPARTTTVAPPAGGSKTYFYNDDLVVDLVQPGTAPALATSGQLPALNGGYDRGIAPYSVDASAADATGGVRRFTLKVDGTLVRTLDNCCGTASWTRLSGQLAYDPSSLREGRHTFTTEAVDDNSTTSSESWTVFIDRTAPLAARGFTSYLDPDTGAAELDWDPGGDPALADGTPGSGGGSYRFRYRRAGGAWSDWAEMTADGLSLPGSFVGETIVVETQAIDSAGNVGSVLSHSFTIANPPADRKMTFVIGDADARESYSWAPTLAAGQSLRLVNGGDEVVVVDGAGVQQYVLTSTWAKDATERSLAYRYSLNGNQLTVTVGHRVADVFYPVVVDTNRTIWNDVSYRRLVRQLDDLRSAQDGPSLLANGASVNRPNKTEIILCVRYADICDGLATDRDIAERVTDGVFGRGAKGEDRTRANAFKHAYWTGIMAGTAGRAYGDTEPAWLMAAAHEANDLTSLPARMDLHNDRVGHDFVASKPFRTSNGTPRYGTDREICREIREHAAVAVLSSDRRRWPSRGLVFIDNSGRRLPALREPCRSAG
ncbi:hypothetical protein Q5424_15645 [Conexibacter sp. JD483]|uniref:DUF6973 domain-containing protein n=1 Tax=unclassified Conexibacter TaxID=2627773 RepID=UPI0027177745|nr:MULTISPECIES: hypothetical protein [unclassified Conexibacter]MDO8185297.1 hypothetical protein [Conexibacter sp. CPCC 205706]MDO8198343.1 hypothetical protein [Conexibacter sp. CPCC 205762]MDR9370530.1 hypothetical protein [Conexibacter sp. JD483]